MSAYIICIPGKAYNSSRSMGFYKVSISLKRSARRSAYFALFWLETNLAEKTIMINCDFMTGKMC